jgi:hypothetical protein
MKTVLQPAAHPAATSLARSPTMKLRLSAIPHSSAAVISIPGFGFRQAQLSVCV